MSKVNCKICSSSMIVTSIGRHYKKMHKVEFSKTKPKDRYVAANVVKELEIPVKRFLGLKETDDDILQVRVLWDLGNSKRNQSSWEFVGTFYKMDEFKKYLDIAKNRERKKP